MSVSKRTDRNVPFLRMSFSEGTSDQGHRLSATISSSMFPVLQNPERITYNQSVTPIVDSDIDSTGASVSTAGDSSGRHYQRRESSGNSPSISAPSHLQHVAGPSVVSRQVLPTYRQVSLSEDGVSPSSLPSTGSESTPYHLESSLPDILYSHITPRLPPSHHRPQRTRSRQEDDRNRGHRHGHRIHEDRPSRRRRHSSWTRSTSSTQTQDGTCKEPCVKCVVTITSFRWVLVVLSVLGVCCVVTGIVLAALHAAGQSFLFLAIMFIGLGVLLVIVVGVGWKCTPRGHEPLHALFGIGRFMHGHSRGRRRRHRNRDRNWFGGMMYPEFQFRCPPPSYAASMQDYQNQVMPEQHVSSARRSSVQNNGGSSPNSPPPSYRSRTSTAHSGILNAFHNIHDGDQSRPPTYRSQASSRRPSFPHEYDIEVGVSEIEVGMVPPTDVSFLVASGAHISPNNAQSERMISTSTIPTAGPSVTEPWSNNLSVAKYPAASLPITPDACSLTLERSIEADNQNSAYNTQNSVSMTSALASSHQQQPPKENQGGTRPPSLHQRMASEDRQILEETLQSLEDHMNDSTGICNEGANCDEQDTTAISANMRA